MSPSDISVITRKIESMNKVFDDYIKEDLKWKESDRIWKENASPVIMMGLNIKGFGKVFLAILGIIATILGIMATLLGVIKFWK